MWYDRKITVNGTTKGLVEALWDNEYGVDAIYSPDGGLAHIYVRETGARWNTPSGQLGTTTSRLAWYLAKESLGDFSQFPGQQPLMPNDVTDASQGSQFAGALEFESGSGQKRAGVFVLVGTEYFLAVPTNQVGVVQLQNINDSMLGGTEWRLLKTRLDEMISQGGASRSGDIVLAFNIKGSFASMNDGTEEELNGWHGAPTAAESITPLVYATAGYGWYPQENAGLPTQAVPPTLQNGQYRNSDIRWSLQALMQSLRGE